MGKADRMTECELEYIRAVYPKVGPTEIARRLGRSRSAVKSRIRQMGLRKPDDRQPVVTSASESESPDTYDRLVELRNYLKNSLVDAPSNCIASLSKEYRAVLHDIEALGKEEKAEEPNPLEQIAKAIINGMQSKT